MAGPLEGIRILDLTRLLPGGYCTQLLADLGADVIKVEDTGRGDYIRLGGSPIGGASGAHWVLNRNKRSIKVDLKNPAGVAVLKRMVRQSHVLVEGFRPGVLDRLGVGYEDLRKENPALVFCAISGFGADGPYEKVAGHDLNYLSYAGALSVCGQDPDGPPAFPGLQIGDMGGGGMASAIGILAALLRARETGEGDFVDISMTDGIVSWLVIHAGEHFASGAVPGRGTEVLNGMAPCYAVYECADGGYVSVGALEPQFWKALCETLGREDLLGLQFSPEGFKALRTAFLTRTRDEWVELFAGVDACVAPVKTVAEGLGDPQILHRRMVVEQEHPDAGPQRQLGIPVKLRNTPGDIRRPAPGHGEHTDEVLAELGFSAEERADLRSSGVLG